MLGTQTRGRQDGRCRRIHRAMAATPKREMFFFLKNGPTPATSVYFWSFHANKTIFKTNQREKISIQYICARILTHDLLNMGRLLLPLDQGSRPREKCLRKSKPVIVCNWTQSIYRTNKGTAEGHFRINLKCIWHIEINCNFVVVFVVVSMICRGRLCIHLVESEAACAMV